MWFLCLSAWQDARASMTGAPRDLLLSIGPLRLLSAIPYYTLSSIFIAFIERSYRITDSVASTYFGVWGADNSFFTLLGGLLCDTLGVRRSLIIGSVALTIGFAMLAFAGEMNALFWVSMYFFIPIGIGLGLPICDVATRRFSSPSNEQIVYPLAYTFSTIGQCVGMAALAISSASYITHNHGKKTADGDTLPERFVLIFCMGAAAAVGLVAYNWLNDKRITVLGEIEAAGEKIDSLRSLLLALRKNTISLRGNASVLRVILMVVITLPGRHVFIVIYSMLAIYLRRTLGMDVPVYAFMLIDPMIEALCAPLFAIFMPQIYPYTMIKIGSFISSCGMLGFVVFQPTYVSTGITLALFAVGGALYVPRIQQVVLVLAPEGKEGQFAALGSVLPIMLGKIAVGLILGSLLTHNCPVTDEVLSKCMFMWTPSVVISFITPVCLQIFENFINTPEVRATFAARLAVIRGVHII
jgi:POT family proton-dependent oligopeptide transporter